MIRSAMALVAALALSACAFGDEKLVLAYDAASAKAGVLSEAPPATIYLADVEDRRVDKMRIGFKRNTYGMKTADILSDRPAPEVIKETLTTVLTKNNHVLGGADQRYALQPSLSNFWFDAKSGFWTVEFFGSVQAELKLVDTTDGKVLYSEVFDGYHSEKKGGGLRKTWERIMNAAIADLAGKVNLSPGLKDAFASINTSPTASSAEDDVVETGS